MGRNAAGSLIEDMPGEILEALKGSSEIELTVKGRASGRDIPRPVWFALSGDGRSLYLIPASGRKTQWYLNVKQEPKVTIRAGRESFTADAVELPQERFGEVVDAFRAKYGKRDIERYYPDIGKDDVAFEVRVPS